MNRQEREQHAQYAAGYDQVAAALQGFPASQLTAHLIGQVERRRSSTTPDNESTSAIGSGSFDRGEAGDQGYDQEAWAKRLRYNEREIAPSLEAFRLARATTMQILPSMSDADWARSGTHSESGSYSAETWLRIYAVHAHGHASQIARLKAVVSSGS